MAHTHIRSCMSMCLGDTEQLVIRENACCLFSDNSHPLSGNHDDLFSNLAPELPERSRRGLKSKQRLASTNHQHQDPGSLQRKWKMRTTRMTSPQKRKRISSMTQMTGRWDAGSGALRPSRLVCFSGARRGGGGGGSTHSLPDYRCRLSIDHEPLCTPSDGRR